MLTKNEQKIVRRYKTKLCNSIKEILKGTKVSKTTRNIFALDLYDVHNHIVICNIMLKRNSSVKNLVDHFNNMDSVSSDRLPNEIYAIISNTEEKYYSLKMKMNNNVNKKTKRKSISL